MTSWYSVRGFLPLSSTLASDQIAVADVNVVNFQTGAIPSDRGGPGGLRTISIVTCRRKSEEIGEEVNSCPSAQ